MNCLRSRVALPILTSILAGCGSGKTPAPDPTSPTPTCFEGGAEELKMTLPAYADKNITVPVLPKDLSSYSYATDNALVAVPQKCGDIFRANITKYQNLTDRNGKTGMPYFFINDLQGGWSTLWAMKDCACGFVIEMHGSGGPGWTAVQFASLFSGMGFVQIILNSQAMPDSMGLKGKLPLKKIEDVDVTNYCGGYSSLSGTCSKFNKPYCYSTKRENILHDPLNYRKYVEGVYEIRSRELTYFLDTHHQGLKVGWPVYLVGNSEGAMVASRYHHPVLDAIGSSFAGRIITAFSCEFTYYSSCAENAKICGDKCNKKVPQLNVIGDKDSYFGPEGSVAADIAAAENGYGASTITGNCRKAYDAQKFETSTVVVMEDAGHGPSYFNDNTWRSLLADFLNTTGTNPEKWESLKACTVNNGVYTCPMDGPRTCTSDYVVNPNATLNEVSTYSCVKANGFVGV